MRDINAVADFALSWRTENLDLGKGTAELHKNADTEVKYVRHIASRIVEEGGSEAQKR